MYDFVLGLQQILISREFSKIKIDENYAYLKCYWIIFTLNAEDPWISFPSILLLLSFTVNPSFLRDRISWSLRPNTVEVGITYSPSPKKKEKFNHCDYVFPDPHSLSLFTSLTIPIASSPFLSSGTLRVHIKQVLSPSTQKKNILFWSIS